MHRYEFKVVPAPRRGDKVRGVRTTEDRFAHALMAVMNDMGRDGWDYVRADTLPCDERVGLTGSKTTFQNMLVFRRIIEADQATVPQATVSQATVSQATASQTGRLMSVEHPPAATPRLGAAEAPAGPSPAIGPASSGMAAE